MYYSTDATFIIIYTLCIIAVLFIAAEIYERREKKLNAAKGIYRTVIENKIDYIYYDENNEEKLGAHTLYGDMPVERLEVRLRRELGNSRLMIQSVERTEIRGFQSYETWVKNATIISTKERN